MRIRNLSILILLSFALAGCSSPPPPSANALPVIDVKIGKRLYRLEVAADAASAEKGLMDRDSMPADHGMLFAFGREEPLSFWMKNTRIPLDIIFLTASGQVDSVQQMKPPAPNTPDDQLPTTKSVGPCKYAIELNEGAAAQAEVKVGDTIYIPGPKAQ